MKSLSKPARGFLNKPPNICDQEDRLVYSEMKKEKRRRLAEFTRNALHILGI